MICAAGAECPVSISASRQDTVLSLPVKRRLHFRLRPKSARTPVTVKRHYKLVPLQTVNVSGATAGLVFDGTWRKCGELMPAVSTWSGTKNRMPHPKLSASAERDGVVVIFIQAPKLSLGGYPDTELRHLRNVGGGLWKSKRRRVSRALPNIVRRCLWDSISSKAAMESRTN